MVILSEEAAESIRSACDLLEKDHLLHDFSSLPKPKIQEFLDRCHLPRSGTKEQLRQRVSDALDAGSLDLDSLVDFLDAVVPWGKQHVYLLHPPAQLSLTWRDPAWGESHLAAHCLGALLNSKALVRLPEEIQISAIEHSSRRLRITAACRCDWFERSPLLDRLIPITDLPGTRFRAYAARSSRILVCLEWDFLSNTAFLQISQLPPGIDCELIKEQFLDLIEPWLDLRLFRTVNLSPAIQRLHELEEQGMREARSHGIHYRSMDGGRLSGRSASLNRSLLKDSSVAGALKSIRDIGIGQFGNFYWLPAASPEDGGPTREMHVTIIGSMNRIQISTFDSEQGVRYVLSRIRQRCSPIS